MDLGALGSIAEMTLMYVSGGSASVSLVPLSVVETDGLLVGLETAALYCAAREGSVVDEEAGAGSGVSSVEVMGTGEEIFMSMESVLITES